MSELVTNYQTSLKNEEVISKAVQYFTNGKWRAQSTTDKIATFVGRPPIPIGKIILTIIAFFFFIVPGIIMYFFVIRSLMRLQNIVITTSSMGNGTAVTIKYTKTAKKLVDEFSLSLPGLQMA